ncbi:hypothetical protein [Bacillus sp. AK031]
MNFEQKKTVLLLMVASTIIGIVIRLLDVSRSSHELFSFYSLDILALLIILACSTAGLILLKVEPAQFGKQRGMFSDE